MSQLSIPVLDADGHVTESYQQIAKYLDEPYRNRPHTFPWYTADGWDRRLVDKFHDWAGNAEEWLRALDKGGMELAVLYPTLGLFMSFVKEPLLPASPLRGVDPERLILTPHNVSHSEAGRRANLRLAFEQILAAGRGEVPAHCVNPEAIPRWRIRR